MTNIVVDLDGVLCEDISYEKDPDYSNRKKSKYFEDLNLLLFIMKNEGRKIIVHTSRFEQDFSVTEKWLRDNAVIYDELLFDKPRGDVYIDDKAVNVKELQILLNGVKSLVGGV